MRKFGRKCNTIYAFNYSGVKIMNCFWYQFVSYVISLAERSLFIYLRFIYVRGEQTAKVICCVYLGDWLLNKIKLNLILLKGLPGKPVSFSLPIAWHFWAGSLQFCGTWLSGLLTRPAHVNHWMTDSQTLDLESRLTDEMLCCILQVFFSQTCSSSATLAPISDVSCLRIFCIQSKHLSSHSDRYAMCMLKPASDFRFAKLIPYHYCVTF